MKKIFFTIISVLLFSISVNAKYVQTCNAKYKTQDGWSKYYTVETTFMTGAELNKATSTWNYDTWSVYAIIFWAQNQSSVIKLSTSYMFCGNEVTQTCITNNIYNLAGADQQETEWEICTKSTCW